MKRLISHYVALYRMARVNNTFWQALCDVFRPAPF
jgi:hypothetical protein